MTQLTIIADTETFPNCFLLCASHADSDLRWSFEISNRRDNSADLYAFLCWLRDNQVRCCGFNIVGFDGPLIHMFMQMGGKATAATLYQKAMAIINSQDDDKWAHMVKPTDRAFPWLDLFRLHHFHNRARSTSLKMLEFVMKMDNIQDLPFAVGTVLTGDQIDVLTEYCHHDVLATKRFYHESADAIKLREQLSITYDRDLLNHDDVKLGSTIFEIALEKAGVQLYEYGPQGRKPRQTKRPTIALKDFILPWIKFEQPEFQRILNWFKEQTITETKGAFEDIVARVNGFDFVFGLGGIHGSVENEVLVTSDTCVIESWDVRSYYPHISFKHNLYPEHLGPVFCAVYSDLFETRKKSPKGTAENAALKLALNGTFGKTNDVFSVFYDPGFMMSITVNGQLMLCMLAERLMQVPTLRIFLCNTDGLEYTIHPDYVEQARGVCTDWEKLTKFDLENARYSRMWILNVNNYEAEYTDGQLKRKGCFEYDLGYHQNHSALIVPKVAEQVLVHGKPIRETVEQWPDLMDFCLRTKVPRNGYLQWGEAQVQNTSRYLVTVNGKPLTKWLPPLAKKPGVWRSFAIESGWKVQICNDIKDADGTDIDYEYYIREIEKLTLCLS